MKATGGLNRIFRQNRIKFPEVEPPCRRRRRVHTRLLAGFRRIKVHRSRVLVLLSAPQPGIRPFSRISCASTSNARRIHIRLRCSRATLLSDTSDFGLLSRLWALLISISRRPGPKNRTGKLCRASFHAFPSGSLAAHIWPYTSTATTGEITTTRRRHFACFQIYRFRRCMLRRISVNFSVGHPRPPSHPLRPPSQPPLLLSHPPGQPLPHRGDLGPLCGRRSMRVGESRGSTIFGFRRALWFINTSALSSH